jgi:hypothetical protein
MVVGFTTTCGISGFLRFMPLSPIFQLYRGGQLYWSKPGYPGMKRYLIETGAVMVGW